MTHENYVSVKLDCIEPHWLIYVDLSGYDRFEGSQSLKHLLSSPLQESWLTPGGSVVKNPPPNAGHGGLIPGSGRSPGGGHGNPHQYSCLETPMDRGAWQATVHAVAKSWTRLSDFCVCVCVCVCVCTLSALCTVTKKKKSSKNRILKERILSAAWKFKTFLEP